MSEGKSSHSTQVYEKQFNFCGRGRVTNLILDYKNEENETSKKHGCQEYAERIFAYSRIFLAFDFPHMQLHNLGNLIS